MLPRPWARQPQYPVAVDESSPFSVGLAFAWSGASPLINLRTRARMEIAGATQGVSSVGIGQSFSAAATSFAQGDAPRINQIVKNFSIIAIAAPTTSASQMKVFASTGLSSASGTHITFAANMEWNGFVSSGRVACVAGVAPWYTSTQEFSWVDGNPHVYGVTRLGGVASTSAAYAPLLYRDGVVGPSTGNRYVSSTSDPDFTTYDKVRVGNRCVVSPGTTNAYTDSSGVQLVLMWNRVLTASEMAEISAHPWQVFAPFSRRIYSFDAGGATGTSITPSTGAVNLSAEQAAVRQSVLLIPGVGAISLSGETAAVLYAQSIVPVTGAVAFTGQQPAVTQQLVAFPGAAAVSLTGQQPSVASASATAPGSATLTLVGFQPTVREQMFVVPGVGAISITGVTPTVGSAGVSVPTVAELTLVGYQPDVRLQQFIVPGVGQLTVSGLVASVLSGLPSAPGAGAVSLSGLQPIITQQDRIAPTVGSIALQGQQPLVVGNQYILPGVGQVTFVGYQPAVTRGDRIIPGVGQVDVTGSDASATVGGPALVVPGVGSISLEGSQPQGLGAYFVDDMGMVWYAVTEATAWRVDEDALSWRPSHAPTSWH